ncbi:hypothetical protein [uncultured Parabacteroides sp.]|jgi:alpha-L-fucosidase|uniref:hypothetical protein n=1 Tax=uncultured Parabacteroides sp. TaxID=512312 RepID=UPI0025E8BE80|nr:hypothetical protein [uncultured Parabacteroides sp.]
MRTFLMNYFLLGLAFCSFFSCDSRQKEKYITSCSFPEGATDRLLLQENITEGQRVEDFALECWMDNQWKVVAEGTTIGYKRILRFDPVETEKARIVIRQSRDLLQIAEIGIYKASEEEVD